MSGRINEVKYYTRFCWLELELTNECFSQFPLNQKSINSSILKYLENLSNQLNETRT